MNTNRFNQVSRYFEDRRVSRRAAVVQGAALAASGAAVAGLGHAVAQDATPVANATPEVVNLPPLEDAVTHLFVQSFQSGTIAPATGDVGTHTVTLQNGLGETVFFADRPSREVGTAPTPEFLDGLGFDRENPPNAAMIVVTDTGETDIAVVELFNPTYDESSHTATYDLAVLANWKKELELELEEAPTDLSNISASFGTTHLFIDGCESGSIHCYVPDGDPYSNGTRVGSFPNQKWCFWISAFTCKPCAPAGVDSLDQLRAYWKNKCNENFADCNGKCVSPM